MVPGINPNNFHLRVKFGGKSGKIEINNYVLPDRCKLEERKLPEVAIIGAGPIGLELAVSLKRLGIRYIQFDAHQIGHTFTWWPRNTRFFSTSERIAIAGIPIQSVDQDRTTGEEYLAYLRGIVEQFDLQVNTYEPVISLEKRLGIFRMITHPLSGDRIYQARNVVVAYGDMHAPNRLGIPGEDLPNVTHYFSDPHPYFRKRLLIVGGRNSAVEAALRCWRAGSQVAISYRHADFDEQVVKSHLLPDLKAQIEFGNIKFFPNTVPVEIAPDCVVLEKVADNLSLLGDQIIYPADFVFLATGFTAETGLLEKAGVRLSGSERTPEFDPKTMETNVAGLYLAGTAIAGSQRTYRIFIENSHDHVGRIVQALTGQWPEALGTISARRCELPFEDIQAN